MADRRSSRAEDVRLFVGTFNLGNSPVRVRASLRTPGPHTPILERAPLTLATHSRTWRLRSTLRRTR